MSRARKQDRFSSTLAVSYREPTSSEPSLGTCADISPSGMFIETSRPAARGVLVRFECVSQSAQGVVRGTARVMWLRQHSEAQGKAGMGVRFVRLEPGSARVIEELIAHASSAGARSASDGPEARATHEEPSVVLTAERTIGPSNRSSSVPPKGLRAPTLRGMYPTDVRSSAPPPAPKERKSFDSGPPRDVKAHTSAPPPERQPPPERLAPAPDRQKEAEQRNSRPSPDKNSPQGLRDRLDRSRRPDETPTTSHPNQSGSRAVDPTVDDRTTAPDGTAFDPYREKEPPAPAKGLGATIHDASQVNKLSLSAGARRGSDNTMGVPSPPPPPWKARHSERPPGPGGVEVIRAVHVTAEEQAIANAAAQARNAPPQAAVAEPVAARTEPITELPGANDPALSDWEPMVEPQRPALRPDRTPPNISEPYMLPPSADEAQAQPGRNWIPWIVVGSGILVTVVLITALGGVKLNTSSSQTPAAPTGDTAAAPSLSAENAFSRKPEPVEEEHVAEPKQLAIITNIEPLGASVSALGTTITSPGKLSFPTEMIQWPLRVRVALAGYGGTEVTLPRQAFVTEGDTMTYELHLALQPIPTALTTPEPAPTPPRTASRSDHRSSPKTPKGQRTASTPTIAATAPPGGTTEPAPGPAPADSSAKSPFDRALECLSRGDNACVISTLGNASGTRELDLLIETYRATGDASSAEAAMRRYLELHADGKRASQYRRALGIATPP